MKQITCFFLFIVFNLSSTFKLINQAVFLNPQTNSTFIHCPVDLFIPSFDIQWYNPLNPNERSNRGRYYRIETFQPFQIEFICFSRFLPNEKIHLNTRIYDRPLPIPYFIFTNITQTSLTVFWKDDNYNQNANITSYKLILKYSHLIQSRILVNRTIFHHTFSSLHPNTNYSIEIFAIDIWNRLSSKKTISNQTLRLNAKKEIFFNQIIDNHLLDESISCYNFNEKYLLIDFNYSKIHQFNQIYNLTIFDQYDQILFTTNFYQSFLYSIEFVRIQTYKIQLIISTYQLEYLGQIRKVCENFFPIYSPLICSIQMFDSKRFYLNIHMQLEKSIQNRQSIEIFYWKNQSYLNRINTFKHSFIDQITDVHERNYSVIVENIFSNEKFNISIPCSIIRKDSKHSLINSPILILSIIAIVLSILICLIMIIYRKLRISTLIPFDQFPIYVSNMHKNNHRGFKQLFQTLSKSTGKKMINNYENIHGYIVVHGPMVNTKAKFWRMIWDEDVRVIIMITDLNESKMIDEYIEMFANIEITLVSKTSFAYYIQRVFSIRCMTNENLINNEHLVYQFQYINWPEYGLPLDPLSLLSFIRHSAMFHSSQNHTPIVIHSSTDSNRIGTFIIIDTVFKRLPQSQFIDVPSVIKYMKLTQTLEQLMFVYDVLLEVIQGLNMNSNAIEKQFQSIVENRKQKFEQFLIPTYIHSYYRMDQYLITKHPLKHQRKDFWTLIWNTKSDTIVSFYGDENIDSDVYDYWPLFNQTIDCETFLVSLIDEYFECDYIYRDCLLRSIEDENDEFRVKIISCSFWPDACSSIETSFHLINTIKNFNSQKSIIVHDQFGGYRAGIFCALYTMKEQMDNAKIFNVYELAKFYDLKRPGIWHDSNDLLFLYRCEEILYGDLL